MFKNTPKVYLAGYAGRTPNNLEALLLALDAEIGDIRQSPRSKSPEWSGASLRARFGSRYHHLPGFGNINYQGGDEIVLANPEQAFQQLQEVLAQGRSVILLCVCWNPARCHRTEVARWLAQHDIQTEELNWTPRPNAQKALSDE
jgi:hypothetical protein